MGRRTPKYKAKPFESKGTKFIDNNGTSRADTSANIYESMLLSRAYQDLKTRQQQLYTICKAQYYGKRKPSKDYPDMEHLQGDDMFYLNLAAVVQYGLYTKNMRKEFYNDMKALEQHGFIKKVSQGGYSNRKSIYQFTADWQTWTPT